MEIEEKVLQVSNLTKAYTQPSGDVCNAVDNLSFSIANGEVLGLLGPNGAGKTTTIQMLLSTLTPTAGSIAYFGKSLLTHRSEILARVGFASAYAKLPPRLRVLDNLNFFGRLYGLSVQERTRRIAYFLSRFEMESFAHQETGSLSAGQMTRLVLAKAFLARPRIVLLDEPTASLDPDIAHEIRSFVIEQCEQEGVSFLFTSHNMAEVTEVCDRVLVLKKGTIFADSSPEQLARSVKKAHVTLLVGDGMKRTQQYTTEQRLVYEVEGRAITITVDEEKIAELLAGLAGKGVSYTQITIKQPTLEDYFLQVARSR